MHTVENKKTYKMTDKTVLAFNISDGNLSNLPTPDFILQWVGWSPKQGKALFYPIAVEWVAGGLPTDSRSVRPS